MALVYVYSDSTGSTIDITDRCRLYQLSVKDQAEEGAVAISSLTIDDPDGDLEITGHRRLYIYEDTAPVGDQIIFNGFVSNERIIRGPSGRTGASRQWVVDLADVNVLINRRIMNGADANRPAETDTERIQALFAMTELNTVDDDSMVSLTATTVDMDAADYRGQNVGAYIDDCRQASGKNAYIYYNETLGEYGLWYDFAESDAYDSECFLSNTIGDSNGTTVFNYSLERTYLNRDPSRVASGIYLEYDGGLVYIQSLITIDNFAAIDWAAPSVNVKTVAKATARANRYLADAASEHEIIHVVQTDVPRASVNAIKKGQLVSFKSSYMTGYESYRTCRVLYRQVTEIAEDPESSFEIEMDLDPIPVVLCADYAFDEVAYPPTESGFLAPLSGIPAYSYPEPDNPNVHYSNGSPGPYPPIPPDHSTDNWGFPLFQHGDVTAPLGFADMMPANIGNNVAISLIGPGTLVIYTAAIGSGGTFPLQLWHGDDIDGEYQDPDDLGTHDAGDTVTVIVPDDGHCAHRVRFDSNGFFSADWTGFAGAIWTRLGDVPASPPTIWEPSGAQPLNFPGEYNGDYNVNRLSDFFLVPSGGTIRVNLTTVPSAGGNIGVVCSAGTTNQFASPVVGNNDFSAGYGSCFVYSWSYDSGRTGAGTLEILP